MSEDTSTPSRAASPVGNLPDIPSSARPFRFTWDPSSRRKGPASVSETTEGRGGDYFGVSPRMDLFGDSSTALAQGALPMEWSSTKHGFHGACVYG
jgi:vacuolar protein sorting-associated protein 54